MNPEEKALWAACAKNLQKQLFLPDTPSSVSREDLAAFICPAISRMLNQDMDSLLQLCYRVDLGEEKLKHILHHSPVACLAMDLSLALVDRQLLKQRLRATYGEGL
ncbi:hypothetical protein [Lunatimonas salinarum]|uniref:hypothetical protein n=1 Tax=Lunatimonas salinarum TaxID=1774590 RepID=UPI001ADEE1F2|nr:hypothetical protein [Lunatimonas salinarum]